MRRGLFLLGVFLTVSTAGSCRRAKPIVPPKAVPVRGGGAIEISAATFNIRNDFSNDLNDRAWQSRVRKAVGLIRRLDPDILAMQEVTHGQAADLRASLPDFEFFGVAREDGGRKGEYAAIFYKTSRFSIDHSESGTFWLSGTPEVPGSKTWGNGYARVATWMRLLDLSTGRGFYVFNTHFDHRHQGSREEAAVLISKRIDGRKHPEEPVMLLGDFNAEEKNSALVYLAGKSVQVAGKSRVWKNGLLDTFRRIHPTGASPGTLHLWGRLAGLKVDHILVSKMARVLNADVAPDEPPFSSDHFPVTARVLFP